MKFAARLAALSALVLALTSSFASATTLTIDPSHSEVGFNIRHFFSKVHGRFEDYDGALNVGEDGAPTLEGYVNVDSVVVKDENLAGHLKAPDFFDSERYPQIRFRSSAVRVQDGGQLEVDGELTIKDHTHNVTARGTISGPHEDIAGNGLEAPDVEAALQ